MYRMIIAITLIKASHSVKPQGIVSTVIIVHVTLGISLDDVESAIVSIRAGSTVHEEALVVDISRSTNGLMQQGRNQGSGSMDREAQRDSENSE
uniref:Uncharacterized protein n=1 Tax=Moniliophthora roreri TaxID=221103 RepID=A0A0W0GCX8_MONRR